MMVGSTKTLSKLESDQHRKQLAKVIGTSFLLMFFLGVFAEFVVRAQLIRWEDPVLTFTNIRSALLLFNFGILAWLVIIFLDVVIAAAFFALLRKTHLLLAWLMVSLRLLYVAIKGVALVGLFLAKDVIISTPKNCTDQIELYASQTIQFLKAHHFGFGVALFFIGLHLVFLAFLLRESEVIPKVLFWLLLVGGIGYSLNSLASLFVPGGQLLSTVIIAVFIVPMTFSELSVGLWLGFKRKKRFLQS